MENEDKNRLQKQVYRSTEPLFLEHFETSVFFLRLMVQVTHCNTRFAHATHQTRQTS